MRNIFFKAVTGVKAIKELGLVPVFHFFIYQIGLRTGWLRWQTQKALDRSMQISTGLLKKDLLNLPNREDIVIYQPLETQNQLMIEADDICTGYCRIFSAERTPILSKKPNNKVFWTACNLSDFKGDVKIIWEPARFGWIYSLGMAYLLTKNEKYPTVFWNLVDSFFDINPPYFGWQWVSAQEVALRLISLVFASQVFSNSTSTTPDNENKLARWIAVHAARIPPSLRYARSQNNNHLLSEAVGLFTAGLALPDHPDAGRWKSMGWYWFLHGLEMQISPEGAYTQHSTNYHRLMLQLVIWFELVRSASTQDWPVHLYQRIQASGRWLASLLDPTSGGVPNLGPNDGALIMPLSQADFADYRPVIQAFWRLFFKQPLLPPGKWDDLSCWLGIGQKVKENQDFIKPTDNEPYTLHHPNLNTWGYLRTTTFNNRPGHADLLHLDLWWNGVNIAQDAGTYRYNDPPPWDNALTHTNIHNTVSIVHKEQMTRVGRFLYLDWANAHPVLNPNPTSPSITAFHDGYSSMGLRHQRSLEIVSYGWQVIDQIIPRQIHTQNEMIAFRLHWLLPDYSFEIIKKPGGNPMGIQLDTAVGRFQMQVEILSGKSSAPSLYLSRAGELVFGSGPVEPTWGWASPTYNQKYPALSFAVQTSSCPPLTFITKWLLIQN